MIIFTNQNKKTQKLEEFFIYILFFFFRNVPSLFAFSNHTLPGIHNFHCCQVQPSRGRQRSTYHKSFTYRFILTLHICTFFPKIIHDVFDVACYLIYVKPEMPICLRLRYDRIFFEEIIKFKSISRTLLQNVLLFVLFFCPLYVDSGLDYKIIHSFGVVKGKSKSTSTFEYYHSTPKYFCT